jgi:hypothetical protein
MSEKDLCWECRKDLHSMVINGSDHCHHEPKEKEKCWCEPLIDPTEKYTVVLNNRSGREEVLRLKFCPECGRSLK